MYIHGNMDIYIYIRQFLLILKFSTKNVQTYYLVDLRDKDCETGLKTGLKSALVPPSSLNGEKMETDD